MEPWLTFAAVLQYVIGGFAPIRRLGIDEMMDDSNKQLSALVDLLMATHATATNVGNVKMISLIEQALDEARAETRRRIEKNRKSAY
jgi:hypothetical protein